MFGDLSHIRMELGINAQKIVSQFMNNNQQLEQAIAKNNMALI